MILHEALIDTRLRVLNCCQHKFYYCNCDQFSKCDAVTVCCHGNNGLAIASPRAKTQHADDVVVVVQPLPSLDTVDLTQLLVFGMDSTFATRVMRETTEAFWETRRRWSWQKYAWDLVGKPRVNALGSTCFHWYCLSEKMTPTCLNCHLN